LNFWRSSGAQHPFPEAALRAENLLLSKSVAGHQGMFHLMLCFSASVCKLGMLWFLWILRFEEDIMMDMATADPFLPLQSMATGLPDQARVPAPSSCFVVCSHSHGFQISTHSCSVMGDSGAPNIGA